MIRDKLHYQNRISILEARTKKDNKRIIAKLKRKLKMLEQNERN